MFRAAQARCSAQCADQPDNNEVVKESSDFSPLVSLAGAPSEQIVFRSGMAFDLRPSIGPASIRSMRSMGDDWETLWTTGLDKDRSFQSIHARALQGRRTHAN